jgi:transcriptional regulator with XRE-family HTH domain
MLYIFFRFMEKIEPDTFLKELGKRIARYRKDQYLTQMQLAEKIGVSQQIIAAYELGTRQIPLMSIFKLAEILSVSVDDLLSIKKDKKKPGPPPLIQKRLEQILKLPQEKQKIILDLLDSYIQSKTQKAS